MILDFLATAFVGLLVLLAVAAVAAVATIAFGRRTMYVIVYTDESEREDCIRVAGPYQHESAAQDAIDRLTVESDRDIDTESYEIIRVEERL
jgi:hypothetical protein